MLGTAQYFTSVAQLKDPIPSGRVIHKTVFFENLYILVVNAFTATALATFYYLTDKLQILNFLPNR